MKEKQFIGMKKKDYFKVISKSFIKKDTITICLLEAVIPVDTVEKALPMITKNLRAFKRKFPKFTISIEGLVIEVKGVAKCSANDTYDEKLGKNIADAKAKAKLFDLLRRVLWYHANCVENIEKENRKAAKFMELCCSRELNFIYRL